MKKMFALLTALAVFLLTSDVFAAINNERVLAGTIKNAYVEWVSVSSINITSGYGDCNGHYFEVSSDVTLTMNDVDGGANGDFYYIYIDDSAATYPTLDSTSDFRYDTEEPSWSDSKQGWYGTTNTDDRCIGTVWVNSSDDIVEFISNSKDQYTYTSSTKSDTNLTATVSYVVLSWDSYTPVNAIKAYVLISAQDSSATCKAVIYDYNLTNSVQDRSYTQATGTGWISFGRNGNRNYKYQTEGDDERGIAQLFGYQIER